MRNVIALFILSLSLCATLGCGPEYVEVDSFTSELRQINANQHALGVGLTKNNHTDRVQEQKLALLEARQQASNDVIDDDPVRAAVRAAMDARLHLIYATYQITLMDKLDDSATNSELNGIIVSHANKKLKLSLFEHPQVHMNWGSQSCVKAESLQQMDGSAAQQPRTPSLLEQTLQKGIDEIISQNAELLKQPLPAQVPPFEKGPVPEALRRQPEPAPATEETKKEAEQDKSA